MRQLYTVWTRRACMAAAVSLAPLAAAAQPTETEFFERKIRPVLVSACLKCHGEQKSSGKLRVDSRAALIRSTGKGVSNLKLLASFKAATTSR